METTSSPNQPLSTSAAPPPVSEPIPDHLNPLLNPILEQNMGRWAQVYFTTPPEKRQQAVAELLRELEDESRGRGSAFVDAPSLSAAERSDPAMQCPVCRSDARPNYAFCTLCGSRLVVARAIEPKPEAIEIPATAIIKAPVKAIAVPQVDGAAAAVGEVARWGSSIFAALLVVSLGTFAYRERIHFTPPVVVVAAPQAAIAGSSPIQPAVLAAAVQPIRATHARRRNPPPDDLPRLQLTEAPQSYMVYPASPQPGLAGTVNLKVMVGPQGRVKRVSALKGNRELAAAAAHAVWQWRYSPPQINDQAAEGETYVSIHFFGQDAVSIKFLSPPGAVTETRP